MRSQSGLGEVSVLAFGESRPIPLARLQDQQIKIGQLWQCLGNCGQKTARLSPKGGDGFGPDFGAPPSAGNRSWEAGTGAGPHIKNNKGVISYM